MKSRTKFMVHTYEPWFMVHGSYFLEMLGMNHGSYFWYEPWFMVHTFGMNHGGGIRGTKTMKAELNEFYDRTRTQN